MTMVFQDSSNSIQGQVVEMLTAPPPAAAAGQAQAVMNPNMSVSLPAAAMMMPTSPTMTYMAYPSQPPTDQPYQSQIAGETAL